MELRKAERSRRPVRMVLMGPSKSGKTFTALRIAHALGKSVAVIDSESGESEYYQGGTNPDGGTFDFSIVDLTADPKRYSVDNYRAALRLCAEAGIEVVVVDSGSHAWAGEGGVLNVVDDVAAASKSGSKFNAWAKGTPMQWGFVHALKEYPGHLIMTLRSKQAYVLEQDGGKQTVKKIGLEAVQREGIEYEFAVVGDLDMEHRVSWTARCPDLDGLSTVNAGADVADIVLRWLGTMEDTWSTDHPLWAKALEGIGLAEQEVDDFLFSLGKPAAADMSRTTRNQALAWLSTDKGAKAFKTWSDALEVGS